MTTSIQVETSTPADFWDRLSRLSEKEPTFTIAGTVLTGDSIFQTKAADTDGALDIARSIDFSFVRQITASFNLPGDANHITSFTFKIAEWDGATLPCDINVQSGKGLEVLQRLGAAFVLVTKRQAQLLQLDPLAQAELTAHRAAVAVLEEHVARLGETLTTSAQRNDEFFTRFTVEFAEQRRKDEESIADRRRQDEEQTRNERAELAEQRRLMNLEASRDVRRELLKKMEETLEKQSKFERSAETKSSQLGVQMTCATIAITGALTAGTALYLLAQGKATGPSFYAPFATGALLVASTAFVLIRHEILKSWRNSDADFSIMQYSRDMYRMSWIAELVFESQSLEHVGQKNVELPSVVLEQFSRSLFELRDGAAVHPLDEFKRFARQFKKVNIGANGVTVEKIERKSKVNRNTPTD